MTPILSDDKFTGWDGGPDPVTWLREYDGTSEWELPRALQSAKLGGSRRCDIAIPGRGLSAFHCLLERRADRLRLYDQHTANGTFVRDHKIDMADLRPGDMFTPHPVTLICMNDVMRARRPELVEIVGNGFTSIDRVMIDAATESGHFLILGEPGCDQDRLAHTIHEMSLRRTRPIMEVPALPAERSAQVAIVKQASKAKTTFVFTITRDTPPIDPAFVSTLFSPTYRVRVIVLAPKIDVAREAFGIDTIDQIYKRIQLRPLAYRTDEIEQLLDRQFSHCRAPQLRTADMKRSNQRALRMYDWPKGWPELRLIAHAIVAHTTLGGLRPAADSIKMPWQTLQKHFARIGLEFPLFGGDV